MNFSHIVGRLSTVIAVFGLLCAPQWGYAETLDGANTAWIITATALVLFMTLPGLALFLRRPGAQQKHPQCADAVLQYHLRGVAVVDGGGLQHGL